VGDLAVAWTRPVATGHTSEAYKSTPAIANGVAYWQDLQSNVSAIDLETGAVLWRRSYGSPAQGPNGVVVARGRVFGATASEAFALDQQTGAELWSTTLSDDESEGIHMTPGYHDGMVYISTVPLEFAGGERGILWALDARSGKKSWRFATVPRDLWGNPKLNFGGGLLEPPAFDDEGSMYIGVGSPGPIAGTRQEPWGGTRPGPNLYTDSIVKLDAATGKVEWYYQPTPHALCDWSLQGPPILIDAGRRKLAIIAGQGGIVVAVDRGTGKLIWKRPVGIHNGHDDDGIQAMRGDFSGLKTPMTIYPGSLGGVASPASTDGSLIFVPVMNYAATLRRQKLGGLTGARTGELVGLDVESGEIAWRQRFPDAVYGATNVVNDLVFATTLDGVIYALESKSGEVVWKDSLPAGMTSGLGINDATVLATSGLESRGGGTTEMVAYRLGG